MNYLLLYTDPYGRATYALTDDPERFLARRVALEKLMTADQAKRVQKIPVGDAVDVDAANLAARVARLRQLYSWWRSPKTLRKLVQGGKMTNAELARVRAEIREHIDDDIHDEWPQKKPDDERSRWGAAGDEDDAIDLDYDPSEGR